MNKRFFAVSMALLLFVAILPSLVVKTGSITAFRNSEGNSNHVNTDEDTSSDNTVTGGEIIDGRYYVNGKVVEKVGIVLVTGDYYFIESRGKVKKGIVNVSREKANGLIEPGTYTFGQDGKMFIPETDTEIETDTQTESQEEGIVNGYYYVNGELAKGAGIILIDGYYYYIGMRGQVFVGKVYVVESKTNGLIEEGEYEFGSDGKILNPIGSIVNGYYYVNGEIVKNAGLVRVFTKYYYIGMRGQVFSGTVYITEAKANGLVEAGIYEFGPDGVMITETEIVFIRGGYYYAEGKIAKGAGVVEYDGRYYYIGSKGQVFEGSIYVTEEKSNGLIDPGVYSFSKDGITLSNDDTDSDTNVDTEAETEIDTETDTETDSNTNIDTEMDSDTDDFSNYNSQDITYEYDKLGRVVKIIYSENNYVKYEYDANGNITNVTVVK